MQYIEIFQKQSKAKQSKKKKKKKKKNHLKNIYRYMCLNIFTQNTHCGFTHVPTIYDLDQR